MYQTMFYRFLSINTVLFSAFIITNIFTSFPIGAINLFGIGAPLIIGVFEALLFLGLYLAKDVLDTFSLNWEHFPILFFGLNLFAFSLFVFANLITFAPLSGLSIFGLSSTLSMLILELNIFFLSIVFLYLSNDLIADLEYNLLQNPANKIFAFIQINLFALAIYFLISAFSPSALLVLNNLYVLAAFELLTLLLSIALVSKFKNYGVLQGLVIITIAGLLSLQLSSIYIIASSFTHGVLLNFFVWNLSNPASVFMLIIAVSVIVSLIAAISLDMFNNMKNDMDPADSYSSYISPKATKYLYYFTLSIIVAAIAYISAYFVTSFVPNFSIYGLSGWTSSAILILSLVAIISVAFTAWLKDLNLETLQNNLSNIWGKLGISFILSTIQGLITLFVIKLCSSSIALGSIATYSFLIPTLTTFVLLSSFIFLNHMSSVNKTTDKTTDKTTVHSSTWEYGIIIFLITLASVFSFITIQSHFPVIAEALTSKFFLSWQVATFFGLVQGITAGFIIAILAKKDVSPKTQFIHSTLKVIGFGLIGAVISIVSHHNLVDLLTETITRQTVMNIIQAGMFGLVAAMLFTVIYSAVTHNIEPPEYGDSDTSFNNKPQGKQVQPSAPPEDPQQPHQRLHSNPFASPPPPQRIHSRAQPPTHLRARPHHSKLNQE